jgi:phosphotransferase system enzyme I (PtsI)
VPSLTVKLDSRMVLGFAAEHGGATSHGAILARALGIPAVTGLQGLTDEVMDGQMMVVDGSEGLVIVDPSPEQVAQYRDLAQTLRDRRLSLIEHACELAVSSDGVRIHVLANVGNAQELELARHYGAEGIGLYRTEVDYLASSVLPSEDALAASYSQATEAFGQREVAFRVLDIGGDKFPSSIPLAHEENPFIGLRGLRLLLEHVEDLMLPQLRAILRASASGPVAIIYPMVASVADVRETLSLFERARQEVLEAGHPIGDHIIQGVMVEVPSAITMLPDMLALVDFASVGTNDLVQYLLAADRNSDLMAEAYDAFHPAVIRTLAGICRMAAEAGKHVSVCGEIGSDPHYVPLLVGLGYRALSVNVGSVPDVKGLVKSLSVDECESLVEQALQAQTGAEIRRLAEGFARKRDGVA